jgi:hypothetical protein
MTNLSIFDCPWDKISESKAGAYPSIVPKGTQFYGQPPNLTIKYNISNKSSNLTIKYNISNKSSSGTNALAYSAAVSVYKRQKIKF